MTYCKECLNKQQKINELEEEIVSLKSKLRYQERTAKEVFFGSSTPSSKLPVKANSQTRHPAIQKIQDILRELAAVFAGSAFRLCKSENRLLRP